MALLRSGKRPNLMLVARSRMESSRRFHDRLPTSGLLGGHKSGSLVRRRPASGCLAAALDTDGPAASLQVRRALQVDPSPRDVLRCAWAAAAAAPSRSGSSGSLSAPHASLRSLSGLSRVSRNTRSGRHSRRLPSVQFHV